MLQPCECRDRAAQALAKAALAPDAEIRAAFEECAARWGDLSQMAEAQDGLQRWLSAGGSAPDVTVTVTPL